MSRRQDFCQLAGAALKAPVYHRNLQRPLTDTHLQTNQVTHHPEQKSIGCDLKGELISPCSPTSLKNLPQCYASRTGRRPEGSKIVRTNQFMAEACNRSNSGAGQTRQAYRSRSGSRSGLQKML